MSKEKNKLVLGIGSQNAGTILLYQILDKCTDIAMHPMTELHYFDTLSGARKGSLLKEFAQKQFDYENNKFLYEYNKTFFNPRHETLLSASKVLATDNVRDIDYFSLFDPMRSESELLGEITPEYMLLDDEQLEKMSEIVGKESKIILLVRDPVDRFLDSLRMLLPPEFFEQSKRDFEKDLFETMLEKPTWLEVQDAFNRYGDTYVRYQKYFDNVLMLSYENFQSEPDLALTQLQDFLQLPMDREKAVSICGDFFDKKGELLEISPSIRSLLEVRFQDAIDDLHQRFTTFYDELKHIDKNKIERLEKLVIEKQTPLTSEIKAFDYDNFLSLNAELGEVLESGDEESIEKYFFERDMDDIRIGDRAFHSDFMAFDEALYCKMYPDVRKVIRNTETDITSGFDHFCLNGYGEIIDKKRYWPGSKEEELDPAFEQISIEYLWLTKCTATYSDPFYTFTFVTNIDKKKYFSANPDVLEAIEADVFEDAADHILANGIFDITAGNRMPYVETEMGKAILGGADHALRIHDHALFIEGWLHTDKNQRTIEKIYLSNGISGFDVTESFSWFARPDLDNMMGSAHKTAGFYSYIESKIIDTKSLWNYALIVVTDDGLSQRFPLIVEEKNDLREASRQILTPLKIDTHLYSNFDRSIGKALLGYMAEYPLTIAEESIRVQTFGEMPTAPKVSVIIPLYGRIDFVEYQLSLFANDPFFKESVELIYILDDPALTDDLISLVQGLYPLFELPFKVVTYDENYGYAIANNIGVRYAGAEKLLLLNSDVMPLEKGWLPQLIDTYDSLENVGALGPKLLFEDGAIQHAGMAFEKSEAFGMWLNEHPGKGLPDLSHEKMAREVPAVTAACLLIDRLLYEKVGGLTESYLIGDFEDSDLCLKLVEEGRKNYYLPSVSLCHLERQSQNLFSDTSWKTKVTLFNGWQHDKRWNTLITKLMESAK